MDAYSDVFKWRQMPQRDPDPKTVCSFCKQTTVAEKLIGGPSVSICTECVDLCNDIITDRRDVHRKKTIEEMAQTLCKCDTALVAERAIALASGIFDAGYRKEVN